jgi:hypothetical protein
MNMKLNLAVGVWAALAFGAPANAQDTAGVGTIRGEIADAAGVRAGEVAVCVPATGQCAVTDAAGQFVLAVRPGTYRLEIAAPGAPLIVSDEVLVRAGLDSVVAIELPPIEGLRDSVTVTAPAFVPAGEVKTSAFLLGADDIGGSAGALQDVARYVQSLPGVVTGTDDFRNDLIVRGGSPLENLYIVDNIEIPNINSFATFASAGGSASMVDVQLVDSVTFLSGGYPAPFGNRTSSVLQIAQREGRRDRTAGRATLAFAGAGGVVEGPLGSAGKGSWIVSARRSFLDLFTDDTGIGGVPVLYTLTGKAVYDVSPRDRIWAINLSGVDTIRLGLTEDSDLSEALSTFDIQYDGWRSATGVNWQRVYARGVGLFGVTHSRARVGQQVTDLLRNGLPPPGTPVEDQIAAGSIVFREESVEADTAVKYDHTTSLPFAEKLQVGASVTLSQIDYDTASPFGTDSPFFVDRDANPFVAREEFRTYQAGAYAQATRALTGALTLTAGVRADRYAFLSATRVSPRLGADLAATPRLTIRGSFGQYYQQPQYLFLSAYPENRRLTPFRADHYVAGITFDIDPATRLSVEAYRKNYRDYPVSSQIPSLSLANVGDTFAIRDILFPMISEGRGRAAGVELYVSRAATTGSRWSGEANVAFSRARYAGFDGVLRPGSFDHPVVVNIDARYRFSRRWAVASRLAYLAGRPFTPLDEAVSASQRRAVYDLTAVNADRLPDYFRLDLRVDWSFGRSERPAKIFFGAQNVTNRANVSRYSWDRRNNELKLSDQLGLFPIVGLEWPF